MENKPRARTVRAGIGLVGLALAVAASAAVAGTAAGSVGVSLRIAASCHIDSSPVVEAPQRAAARVPDVRCAIPTPRAVRVTQEVLPAVLAGDEAAPQTAVRVVTLVF